MVKPGGLSKRLKKPPPRKRRSPRQVPPSRPAEPAEDLDRDGTEKRILAAARKEFVAKGLDGARMQAIATSAGVNKALLHYYFRGKDRLYRTVLADTMRTVWNALQEALRARVPKDGDLETLARTLITTYLHTLARNPDFPLLMFREMSSGGSTLDAVFKEVGVPFGDIPARLLKAYGEETRSGRIKPGNPLHFLVNIIGMGAVTFLARPLIEKLGPMLGTPVTYDAAFLDQRAESIVDTVMNGIRARKGVG